MNVGAVVLHPRRLRRVLLRATLYGGVMVEGDVEIRTRQGLITTLVS